jgi:nitroreductase
MMNTLKKAIKIRRSRRKYLPEPLKISAAVKLQVLIEEYNSRENLDMRLVTDNGEPFGAFRSNYGLFAGVRNYIALIGNKNDAVNIEKLGYYGQLLVLHATSLGLGTCWVGASFDHEFYPFDLDDTKNESIIGVITVGNVSQDYTAIEKYVRKSMRRKNKTAEQMYISDEPVPAWFLSGMEAVRTAPSAVNRKSVMFTYKDNAVTASVRDINAIGAALDLGIAKLHFEIGADGGVWEFGNGGGFIKNL